jgi:hypothetical protein
MATPRNSLLELEEIGAGPNFKLNLHHLKTLPSVSSFRLQPTPFSCKFHQKTSSDFSKNVRHFTAQKTFRRFCTNSHQQKHCFVKVPPKILTCLHKYLLLFSFEVLQIAKKLFNRMCICMNFC